jgi:acetyl-CoA carboxylase biotin carboxyl carrier protein
VETKKTSTRDTVKIDLDQIRDLLSVVSKTDITELTIESGDQKITIKKAPPQFTQATFEVPVTASLAPPPVQPKPLLHPELDAASAPRSEEKSETNGWVAITSPMVGTFYRAPSPTAPAFVEIGDRIAPGQTICIIEAMKLMNDLPAEIGGKIVRCCVDNGTTVEYGQQLFLVDPKA